jgi:hypothetical protein
MFRQRVVQQRLQPRRHQELGHLLFRDVVDGSRPVWKLGGSSLLVPPGWSSWRLAESSPHRQRSRSKTGCFTPIRFYHSC